MAAETVTAAVTEKPSTSAPAPDPIDSADGGSLAGEFADLDALDDAPKAQPKAPAKPAVKAPAKPEKPAPKEPAEPEPEKVEPPKDPDKPVEKVEVKAPEKPVKAADLRTAYESLKKRVREEYEPKVQQLEAKVKEYEGSPKPDAELKAVLSKLEAAEKRRAELEDEIRFVNYQKSEEFLTKFDKPYKEAWSKAMGEVRELTVESEDGTVRQATEADLLAIANMPLGEAMKHAKALFGEAAGEIMAHRRKIRELADAQQKALDEAQRHGGEREKMRVLETKQQHEKTLKLWQETNEGLAKKYPRWFAPEDGDEEGNALLAKGFKTVDRMFSASADNPGPQTPEEAVRLHALIRNKAANHDRLALRVKRASARIKELEAEVAAFEKSEPHGGEKVGSAAAPASGESWEHEIEALDK